MRDCDRKVDALERVGVTENQVPVILVAGTGSGVGKTSVTLATVRALSRSGLRVQPFKVGPDFLDPTYLSSAAGRTCYNLDTWMCGAGYAASLVARKARDADVVIVEGAMGLFDGAAPDSDEGSAAEIARLLGASVLLVCDAAGQGRSFAATVKGFVDFDSDVKISGVIANRVGSPSHVRLLETALQSAHLPSLIGGIEKGALPKLHSRHLGLVAADASEQIDQTIEILADVFDAAVSIETIWNGNRSRGRSPCLPSFSTSGPTFTSPVLRLGIARDAAFSFYYPDNLEAFEAAGFELVPFSPIADPAVPEGLDALYIGGGYPEMWAAAFSKDDTMRASIRSFCRSGRPVYAECGGLMYLSEAVVSKEGEIHPMAGVLPGVCRMQQKLQALGYAEVVLKEDSLFGDAGTSLRGHAFHYSMFDDSHVEDEGWRLAYEVGLKRGRGGIREGYQKDNVLISYVHLHFASHPAAVLHFRDRCARGAAGERKER